MYLKTTVIKKWNPKQEGTKPMIVDRSFLETIAAERSAQEAKSNKIINWSILWLTVAGILTAIIGLFK